MKVTLYSLILMLLTVAGITTACTPPEQPYLMPVTDFSFTGLWDEIQETTGASGNQTHLQSFDLRIKNDKVMSGSARFSSIDNAGHDIFYRVDTDTRGKLQWNGRGTKDILPPIGLRYDPAKTFAELDRLGVEAVIDSARSVGVRIENIYNERQYDYADMFRLDDGELLPLREASFPKDAVAVQIQVDRSYEREEAAPFALGRFRVTSEWWFTGNDLEKADSVVFAKNRQGPEFVGFLKGVYEALPEGWEMSLSTHEGHMNPPEGLEEPLFVLIFEDTVNSFTLPADPANTPIVPGLRLFFYDIAEKEARMEKIEQQQQYSWDIPVYYDESPLYLAVTSPVYINSGHYGEEEITYYRVLEKALKEFFDGERTE